MDIFKAVWDSFFMLLTVIPVSKMLSSIFMKLITRVGTIDEDKWAAIGLGAIGTTYKLLSKNKSISSGRGGSGGDSGGSVSTAIGRTIGFKPNSTMGPTNTTGSSSTELLKPTSSTGSSIGVGSSTSATSGNSIPPRGERKINDIISSAGQTGSKAAETMAKVGALSSFPVPVAAPAVAGLYAATGKAVGGFTSVTKNLAQEINTRKKNGQNFWQSAQQITGSDNRVSATMRMMTACALSPMGSKVSAKGMQMTGKATDWTVKNLRMPERK